MTAPHRLVVVVDDDVSVRESLPDLLRLLGHEAEVFASAADFLGSGAPARADCLILDVAMPGMSGPALMRQAAVQGRRIPVIFITALHDGLLRHRLLAQGASACLFKPFGERDLVDALGAARIAA